MRTDALQYRLHRPTYIERDVTDNKTDTTAPSLKDCITPSITSQTQNILFSMQDNLNREEARRKTFINWPHAFLDPNVLAMTGFYFVGPNDNVKCYFCKVEIGRWEQEDNEVTEHMRWSQNCPLLRRRQTTNVPMDSSALDRVLPPQTYDVCGSGGIEIRYNTVSEGSFEVAPTALAPQPQQVTPPQTVSSIKYPDHPEYAIESARLRSYEDWPKTMKQKPKDLSDAGFFYTSKGDRVKCFSCGGGLRDWDENDDPWEQHAQWFRDCEYLKLIKGQEYIDAVLEAASQSSSDDSEVPAETTTTTSSKVGSKSEENSSSNGVAAAATTSETSQPKMAKILVGGRQLRPRIAEPPKDVEASSEKKVCDSKLCKICYSCEYNTAFLPCGHVVACAKCASSVTKCPMCRKPYERVMRVYFS